MAKLSPGAESVIEAFRQLEAGTYPANTHWTRFQLEEGDFDEIQSALQQDNELWGFVDEKVRHDHYEDQCLLVIRSGFRINERFIVRVERDIWRQLEEIGNGSDRRAKFARDLFPIGHTTIRFDNSKSRHDPDISFAHDHAVYAGVIIEFAYSQNKRCLRRLAEEYILKSESNIRAVVCVNVDYDNNELREATLSTWRPQLRNTTDGLELRAVGSLIEETFRNGKGEPVDSPGICLRLSDFAYDDLAKKELGDEYMDISIPGIQLCQYLHEAYVRESKMGRIVFDQPIISQ
ncbi:hypothetical protein BU24DRAFT_419080 [Aaosphaeria arxii CBS 175.79]|uniref:Uncharacterized protein n=1 Tax=Aaosphaeria arxii CBS 175.79 TaxID=1450172 RepID=A0A6A5Y4M6_9PLEO|nr:uncharacterized protein BU24DRAFT_419080 [Aaosphaeria arxii CBS 175.79]KAF2019464.1 hypothetical protein BU24DRAFT_419080 [Aaosphaeria arxii CBS 175.79]